MKVKSKMNSDSCDQPQSDNDYYLPKFDNLKKPKL